MCCVRRSSVRKVLASGALALVLLSGAPLAAMEMEKGEAAPQAAASGWLTDLWSGLTAWLTEALVATPPPGVPPSQGTVDNGCIVDPHGGCGG